MKKSQKKETAAFPSVADDILESMAEFTEALRNNEVAKRMSIRRVKFNLQPAAYDPELVRMTRKLLNASQTLFAEFLGTSPKTVRSWEQGINPPSKMACRFMDEIRNQPEFWRERLAKSFEVQEAAPV